MSESDEKFVSVYDAFGVESPVANTREIPLKKLVPVGNHTKIQPDPAFVFSYPELRRALTNIARRQPIWVWGESGCGKTEYFRQIAARIQRPLHIISCGEEMSVRELLGTFELVGENPSESEQDNEDAGSKNPLRAMASAMAAMAKRGLGMKTRFRYGLLPQAIRTPGALVMFDEFNMAPPSVAAQLNRLLETGELFIPETGERIKAADHVVFIATANTNGGADSSGIYAGSQVQNGATRTRFTGLKMSYLKPEQEVEILRRNYPSLDNAVQLPESTQTITEVMVETANSLRVLVSEGEVSLPFSVRQLKNWGQGILLYRDVVTAFKDAYYDMLDPEEATPVAEVFHKHFGKDVE